ARLARAQELIKDSRYRPASGKALYSSTQPAGSGRAARLVLLALGGDRPRSTRVVVRVCCFSYETGRVGLLHAIEDVAEAGTAAEGCVAPLRDRLLVEEIATQLRLAEDFPPAEQVELCDRKLEECVASRR